MEQVLFPGMFLIYCDSRLKNMNEESHQRKDGGKTGYRSHGPTPDVLLKGRN